MSTPRPTAQDKFAAMFEKMIDDFCDTHSSDEIEAMFAKCDELFGGIEKRHRSPEGVAAPLEPTQLSLETFLKEHPEFIGDDIGADDYGEIKDPCEFAEAYAAAVSKNLQEELAKLKLTHEFAELHIAELEKEITALRETK